MPELRTVLVKRLRSLFLRAVLGVDWCAVCSVLILADREHRFESALGDLCLPCARRSVELEHASHETTVRTLRREERIAAEMTFH